MRIRDLNIEFYPRESHLITFLDPWSFPTLFHPACNQLVQQHMIDLALKVLCYISSHHRAMTERVLTLSPRLYLFAYPWGNIPVLDTTVLRTQSTKLEFFACILLVLFNTS